MGALNFTEPFNHQLTLGIQLRDEATFSNFYAGENAAAVDTLTQLLQASGIGDRTVFLWGAAGSGRTHLLQACCHRLNRQGQPVVYLPLRTDTSLQPEILDGIENLALVCLDDIDAVMGNAKWEEALFHFYNRAFASQTRLIIVGDSPPMHLPCELPDLRSRLGAGVIYQIRHLDDAEKVAALQMRAKLRGILLNDEVSWFLLRHYRRDTRALFGVLDQLDHASLAAQRRITVPFVKQVLAG